MTRKLKLGIFFIMSLLICMIFAVIASAETYTVKYCDANGSSKATASTDENGKITLRDTSVTTKDGKVFYGWFTTDGTFYASGEEVTLTENTNFREAYAYVISSVDDLNTYVKSSYRNSLLRLDADLEVNSSTGLPGWEANNGTTCIYFDLNGHTITAKGTGDLFSSTRMYMQFFNSDSDNEGKIIANELKSTDGIYAYGKHGSGDSQNYGIVVGKNVYIETTGSLFRIPNDYCTTGSGAGFTCPNIKIWGTVVAHSLVNNNSKRTMLSNIDIYSSADVTLTGTTWWLNPRTDYTSSFADFMVEQGAKITITNKEFNWAPSADYLKYVEYDIKGGAVNVKFPSEILSAGYDSIYNAETGYYTVEYVACTLEGSNGVHKYAQAEYCDGFVPTCTTSGKVYYRCGCGSYYMDTVSEFGHDYSIIKITKPATATENGKKLFICSKCDSLDESGNHLDDACAHGCYYEEYSFDASEIMVELVVKDGDTTKTVIVKVSDAYNISDGVLNGIKTFADPSDPSKTYNFSSIVKLIIPTGVTSIPAKVIYKSSNLEEIIFVEGANATLAKASIDSCSNLKKIVAENCTLTFKEYTVSNCANLSTIDITNANATFEKQAFSGNTAIKHLLMGSGHTYSFGIDAFRSSGLEQVILPDDSKVSLSQKSFAETKTIKYVYIGKNCISTKNNGMIALGDNNTHTSIFGGNAVLSKVVMMDVEWVAKWTFSVKTSGDFVAKNDIYIYCHADSITFDDAAINDRKAYDVYIYAKNVAVIPTTCDYIVYQGIPHRYIEGGSLPSCTMQGSASYTTDCPCGIIADAEYTVTAYSGYTGSTAGGAISAGEVIPALGHEFDPTNGATVVGTTPANCLRDGTITYKCARCDETSTVDDENNPQREHNIDGVEFEVSLAATCLTDGLQVKLCKDCKLLAESEIIPATGHTANGKWEIIQEGTCTVGETRVQYCANDGCSYVALSETDAPSGHTPSNNWTVVVEQTCLEGGIKYQRCATCNTICEEVVTDALGHEFDIADGAIVSKIKYENGFDKNGTVYVKCLRCDETSDSECAPIFSAKGYSVNESGTALNGGYTVDLSLLKAYMEVNGEVEFGVIIANANTFNGSFFEKNAVNNSKALQVVIDAEYSNFDCSISFGTTSNNTLELVICAYVIDENGNATFIQAQNDYALEATIGEQTFTKVTLDLVKANVSQAPVAILPSTNDEE